MLVGDARQMPANAPRRAQWWRGLARTPAPEGCGPAVGVMNPRRPRAAAPPPGARNRRPGQRISSVSASAIAAGAAWTARILRDAVSPPYTPAITTQPRKNVRIGNAITGLPISD